MDSAADGEKRTPPEQARPAPEQLTEQITSQVTALETESLVIENSEVQSRVRHLIKLIKTSLQARTLDHKTQKELARLLSLTPKLDGRHVQQLNLLDLAVSMLLEPGGGRVDGRADGRADEGANGGQSTPKNLIFVQETRRQIANQSRAYPDLFKAIFITGGGTPYIRLISGLSWFFLLFVMVPLTVAGVTFAARDIAGFTSAQSTIEELSASKAELENERDEQLRQNTNLIIRQDSLAAQLGRTNSQLSAVISEATPSPSGNVATPDAAADTAEPEAEAIAPVEITINRQTLLDIQQEIAAELNSSRNRMTDVAVAVPVPEPVDTAPEEIGDLSSGPLAAADHIFSTRFSLILLAIAMGALGSTISVIVRANTFIRQAQENNNDLFLTGFFRPFVGMSFAIFCVALVEAGIFSGIFDVTNRRDDEARIYFYVAIAFVAGFSERLVRDVVIKTEDTLAGPTGNGDRWT